MIGRGGLALSIAALLGLAACRLPRESPPNRYWMLTPVAAVSDAPRVERTLGVGPLELPAYLDRAEIVTRSGVRLQLASFDLWGQPLDETVIQVLGQDLERLLPGTSVALFPWKVASRDLNQQVAVHIVRFEADADGAVHLDASWDLRSGSGTELLSSGDVSIREDVGAEAGVEAIVGAMSRALGGLSRSIAERLAGTPSVHPATAVK